MTCQSLGLEEAAQNLAAQNLLHKEPKNPGAYVQLRIYNRWELLWDVFESGMYNEYEFGNVISKRKFSRILSG